MAFHSFHGYYTEEQSVGNPYEIDVVAELALASTELDDDLDNTINYEDIYQICKQRMAKPQRLIETVAHQILADLRSQLHHQATYTVEVRKLNPLLGGLVGYASYEVSG